MTGWFQGSIDSHDYVNWSGGSPEHLIFAQLIRKRRKLFTFRA